MGLKILALTDFSENSWHAITYACKLLEAEECDFYVLHAYLKEWGGLQGDCTLDPESTVNKMVELNSVNGLGHVIDKLSFSFRNKRHQFHMVSEGGALADSVKKLSKEMNIDLIVMGSGKNKENGFKRLGGNIDDLISYGVMSPILMVPPGAEPLDGGDILLFTGNKTNSCNTSLEPLKEIISKQNARIHIYDRSYSRQITKSSMKNNIQLSMLLEGVDHRFMSPRDHPLAYLTGNGNRSKWAMICYIQPRPKHRWLFGFKKPTLPKLTGHDPCPVMILNE